MKPAKSIDDFINSVNHKIQSLHQKRLPRNNSKPCSDKCSPIKKTSRANITKTPTKLNGLDSTYVNVDSLKQLSSMNHKISLEEKVIKLKNKLKKAKHVISSYQLELRKAFETIAELKESLGGETVKTSLSSNSTELRYKVMNKNR